MTTEEKARKVARMYPEGSMSRVVAEAFLDQDKSELERLERELARIAEFGKQNPGYGWTCSQMAKEALEGVQQTD